MFPFERASIVTELHGYRERIPMLEQVISECTVERAERRVPLRLGQRRLSRRQSAEQPESLVDCGSDGEAHASNARVDEPRGARTSSGWSHCH